ncbi:MAG: hypothetical protein N2513_02590 [Deltaproteobacteria bacterium]|nr:hypothetical protein [Deltaproteobacteria bacterium]
MEEKEVLSVFHEMFDKALPILKNLKEGFNKENGTLLKEEAKKFGSIIKSYVPFFDGIAKKREKDNTEKKAIELLTIAQMIAAGIENLATKMILKVESSILFSEKAKKEISDLLDEVVTELRDLKDFVLTKNPELRKKIDERTQKIIKMAYDFDSTHQRRLITGICMPQASYIYLDMTDSIRKISREMRNLAEKV